MLVSLPADVAVIGSPLCNFMGLDTACAFDFSGQAVRFAGPFIGGRMAAGIVLEV